MKTLLFMFCGAYMIVVGFISTDLMDEWFSLFTIVIGVGLVLYSPFMNRQVDP